MTNPQVINALANTINYSYLLIYMPFRTLLQHVFGHLQHVLHQGILGFLSLLLEKEKHSLNK